MSCPVCGSERLRPSRPRGGLEAGLRSLTGTRYHACQECGHRVRLPRGGRDSARPGVDWTFWLMVALIGAGLVFAYVRLG
jgi:hypothetical protein